MPIPLTKRLYEAVLSGSPPWGYRPQRKRWAPENMPIRTGANWWVFNIKNIGEVFRQSKENGRYF